MRLFLPLLALALLVSIPARASDAPHDMKERLRACAVCHGDEGRSGLDAYYPTLAGKPAGYLEHQLRNFRDGHRHNPVMEGMLGVLSDDYLRAIAGYYAAQSPADAAPPASASAETLGRGRALVEHGDAARKVPACHACHGKRLTGTAPDIPGLIGLRVEYLTAQLGAWREGVRKATAPDCMAAIVQRLDSDEIAAVTAYIASLPVQSDRRPSPRGSEKRPLDCGSAP